MRLREIARHRYAVLAILHPADGESVLSLLDVASQRYPDLYIQMMAMLIKRAPTSDPPLGKASRGLAGEKELRDGLWEFVALGGAKARRQRSRQTREEREMGLRIFFFRYDKLVICTNGCFKASTTPEGAIPAALTNKATCLEAIRGNGYQIETED